MKILFCGDSTVKELCYCPERAHSGDRDAAALHFAVQRTAVREDEGFRRAIDIDIRNWLKSGDGCDIDDFRALFHVRDRKLTKCHDRFAVEVYHIELDIKRSIECGAEFTKSAGIDEQTDARLSKGR